MQSDLASASAVVATGVRSQSLLPHFALASVLQLLAVAHQATEVCAYYRCLSRAHSCSFDAECWLRVHGSSSHWLAIECRAAWHIGSWLEHSPLCEDVEQGERTVSRFRLGSHRSLFFSHFFLIAEIVTASESLKGEGQQKCSSQVACNHLRTHALPPRRGRKRRASEPLCALFARN